MFSLSDVILSPYFKPNTADGKIEILRSQNGTYVDGIFVQGTEQTLRLDGIIIDNSSREVVQHLTGDRVTGSIEIFTVEQIFTSNEELGTYSDYMNHPSGNKYRITQVVDWSQAGFYQATLKKV